MDQVTDQDRRELDSHNMGIEDYTLGRPNRVDNAPCPVSYQDGWNEAARSDIDHGEEVSQRAEQWADMTAYDMDPDLD